MAGAALAQGIPSWSALKHGVSKVASAAASAASAATSLASNLGGDSGAGEAEIVLKASFGSLDEPGPGPNGRRTRRVLLLTFATGFQAREGPRDARGPALSVSHSP